eukprot:763562-Hanusia_phi.AAC.3
MPTFLFFSSFKHSLTLHATRVVSAPSQHPPPTRLSHFFSSLARPSRAPPAPPRRMSSPVAPTIVLPAWMRRMEACRHASCLAREGSGGLRRPRGVSGTVLQDGGARATEEVIRAKAR